MTPTTSKIVASARKWMKRAAHGALLAFRFDTEPAPASRPRVGRFGVYYGKNYERFRREAATLAEAIEGVPTDRPLIVMVEAVCTKPKTGTLTHPRGDVDNYVKGPLDTLTKCGKVWGDDNQIVGLTVFKRYTVPGEQPHVRVEWFPLEDTTE